MRSIRRRTSTGFHVVNAGRLATGGAGAGALHAAGLPAAAEGPARRSFRQAARSWSGAPTSSASRWRSCCSARTAPSRSRIRAPATCRRMPPRRYPGGGRRQAGDGPGRLGGARRHRHRCRHQPHPAARRQGQARRRRRLRRGGEACRRHHAGAGRGRADDHRRVCSRTPSPPAAGSAASSSAGESRRAQLKNFPSPSLREGEGRVRVGVVANSCRASAIAADRKPTPLTPPSPPLRGGEGAIVDSLSRE